MKKTRCGNGRVASFLMAGALAGAFILIASTDASAAGHGHFGGFGIQVGHGYGYVGHAYHRRAVHVDRVYHADYLHWTPSRGIHTHGHIDYVPHYTPRYYRSHVWRY